MAPGAPQMPPTPLVLQVLQVQAVRAVQAVQAVQASMVQAALVGPRAAGWAASWVKTTSAWAEEHSQAYRAERPLADGH